MVAPLIGLLGLGGLMVGGKKLRQGMLDRQNDKDYARRQERLAPIFGQAPQTEQMGPAYQGQMQTQAIPGSGSGLLGQEGLSSQDRERMKAAQGIMAIPGMGAQGSSLLSNVWSGMGQLERTEMTLQQQEAQNAITAQATAAYRDSEQQRQNDIAQRKREQAAWQYDDKKKTEAANWKRENPLAAAGFDMQGINGDYSVGMTPEGQQVAVPRVGTDTWKQNYEEMQSSNNALSDVDEMMNMILREGGATLGENKGRYEVMHKQIMSHVRVLHDMGAPQAAELELLAGMLPNPSEWGEVVHGKDRWLGAYDQLRSSMVQGNTDARNRYKYNQGMDDVLNTPMPVNPWEQHKAGLDAELSRRKQGGALPPGFVEDGAPPMRAGRRTR